MQTKLLGEGFSLVAPLALRFWDPVALRFVTSDLLVTATALGQPARPAPAILNLSGAYCFIHLPGLRSLEQGAGDSDYWNQIAALRRPFQVTVVDQSGHFLPMRLAVMAPFKGIYTPACAGSAFTVSTPPTSVPLFSAPTRPTSPGMAVIRSELRLADQPAAWAVLEGWSAAPDDPDAELVGRGQADAQGRVALFLPWPRPKLGQALDEQSWPIHLRTRYTPALAAASPPEFCAVLQQPVASVTPIPATPVNLFYGREVIVK